jgi:hypothetical protein
MHLRRTVAWALALLALLVTSRARAWQEAHQAGDDVSVHVEPNGLATVRHRMRWRVVRGPLRWIDVMNVDASAILEPEVTVGAEDGRALSAHLARRPDERSVRVTIDDPRALMHGTFTFDVRWRLDLVASHAVVRDGANWRLTWSAPVAADGFDSARTVIDLPAAPDGPQPILADTGAVDDSVVAALRHEPGRDLLELVRPHVARGEAVTWTVRIDPRVFSAVGPPPLLTPADSTAPPEPNRVREVSFATALGALCVLFALLVASKGRAFATACAKHGAPGRGLLPLPEGVRAAAAGIALAAGVGLQVLNEPTAGGLLVAVATLAAALRAPATKPAARGPGRWLVLRPDHAFDGGPGGGHWMDVRTLAGRATALIALALVAGLAVVARRLSAQGPWLVAMDAAAFVPLFATGRRSQLPPDGVCGAAPWLARAFSQLKAIQALRVVPWARVTIDGSVIDELRLLVLPRAAMPGLVGIEIGLAWSSTPVGWVATPEVLVRVLEGTAAATKLVQVAPRARVLPGRRADERVARLLPRDPTRGSTVALARAAADALTDRRGASPTEAWTATDRRVAVVSAPRHSNGTAAALRAGGAAPTC